VAGAAVTRINLVDPTLLIDAHLGAEYRELPRIYGLVLAAQQRGVRPNTFAAPVKYTLGSGHCLFFYNKLMWVNERYSRLVQECRVRGRVVNFPDPPLKVLDPGWFGYWQPSSAEIELSVKRLNERGGLRVRPQFQTA
jgi:deoxyribonuclease (pyrimidine dimer)